MGSSQSTGGKGGYIKYWDSKFRTWLSFFRYSFLTVCSLYGSFISFFVDYFILSAFHSFPLIYLLSIPYVKYKSYLCAMVNSAPILI